MKGDTILYASMDKTSRHFKKNEESRPPMWTQMSQLGGGAGGTDFLTPEQAKLVVLQHILRSQSTLDTISPGTVDLPVPLEQISKLE
jgi:hypothetical protein